jgi:hypothetical protein
MRGLASRVSNTQDVIDSRDILERIEELETELQDAHEGCEEEPAQTFDQWLKDVSEDDDATMQDAAKELLILRALVEEIDQNAGDRARDGVGLIRDSYFETYAREMAEDIGAIGRDAPWPACHIDWEAAADALKQDYSSIDYDGVEYWVRC